jgi:hypothetical protein
MSDKEEKIDAEEGSSRFDEAVAEEDLDDEENASENQDQNGDGEDENAKSDSARRPSISSAITFADSNKQVRCHNCTADWSKQRKLLAIIGCLSSILVCIIRLKIDPGYQTYTIHSIIVFFDMVLIHLFTATKWLVSLGNWPIIVLQQSHVHPDLRHLLLPIVQSISGESITIVSMLLYHYTKQKVWELLETTLLAMICSFHMISSRSEHWDREEELEGLIGLEIIANDTNNTNNFRRRTATADRLVSASGELENESTTMSFHTDKIMEVKEDRKLKFKRWSQHFFEHFLDGSAGVMYTSFLGLIIDEFIVWGTTNSVQN